MDSLCWASYFNASVLPRESESQRDENLCLQAINRDGDYCVLLPRLVPLSESLKILLRKPINEAFTLVLLQRKQLLLTS